MQQQCPSRARLFHAGTIALGAALSLLTLSGCGGCNGPKPPSTPVVTKPFADVTLRVACPDGPARRVLERHGRSWQANTGAKLEVTTYPADGEPAADADVWVIEPAALARWADAGRLQPVPRAIRERDDWEDLLGLYKSKLLVWGADTYALPLLGDATVCVYRTDLFRAAGKVPPRTVDEFAELAEFFGQHRGRPSLPPLPAADEELDREFFTLAAPLVCRAVVPNRENPAAASAYSFHYDLTTGECRIASPGFVEALRLMQRLRPHRAAALGSDDVALGVVSLRDLGRRPAGGPSGRWGVVAVPGSTRFYDAAAKEQHVTENFVPYVGVAGALGAVPQGSAHADAAWNLLTVLSGPDSSRETVHEPEFGSGPFRGEHLSTRFRDGWYRYGLGDRTSELVNVLGQSGDPRLINPALRLRTPDERPHQKVLVEVLRRALTDGGDPAAALKEVERRWRELDGAGGPDKRRANYRKSLSL